MGNRFAPMGSVLCETLPILWVVDADGELRLAWEEIIDDVADELVGPKPAGLRLPAGFVKLGHPALLDDQLGRIGGELIWDDGDDQWVLTNKSGRYGFGGAPEFTRSPEHLENAAELFRIHGINVATFFYA